MGAATGLDVECSKAAILLAGCFRRYGPALAASSEMNTGVLESRPMARSRSRAGQRNAHGSRSATGRCRKGRPRRTAGAVAELLGPYVERLVAEASAEA